ncbi:PHP domain-containing protein [Streptomyces sp. NPDC057239]|uniref:PHP domain-containing protein n=1 Tax=Streptomyces sp. NPDC057239 TaxID=3346061 RepID=UPI0036320627
MPSAGIPTSTPPPGFSTHFGAAHPEQLVQRAAERGMTALALTDRDADTGAVRFAC